MQLLLLSNSTVHKHTLLSHALDALADLLKGVRKLTFIPYALADHTGYTQQVRRALAPLGIDVVGVHEPACGPLRTVAGAEAIYIGGGNTFRLLERMYREDLIGAVHDLVSGGAPYVGSSAGTNVACPTLRTTNDMPIVQPPSFDALELIPFQINCHYVDRNPDSTHMGETRQARIAEFLEENAMPVLGLLEGTWVRRDGKSLRLGGQSHNALLFSRDAQARVLPAGSGLDWLLSVSPPAGQSADAAQQRVRSQ